MHNLGINPNLPKSELVSLLTTQATNVQLDLRQTFFEELVSKGLGNEGDELVSRRCSGRKSLSVKLSEDICSLLHCLKNNSHIPRSIIKNGKRDKNYLDASRALCMSQSSQPVATPVSASPPNHQLHVDASRALSLSQSSQPVATQISAPCKNSLFLCRTS